MAEQPMSKSSNGTNYFTSPLSGVKIAIQGTNTLNFGGGEVSESEKWNRTINALGQTDPENVRRTLVNSYQLHTERGWESVLETPIFQDWKSGYDFHNSLIWVCSGASTFKTALAIFITKHLESCTQDTNDRVLYYFCAGEGEPDESRKTAASILKGLMFSLCKNEKALTEYFYEQLCNQGDPLLQDHQIEALWEIFENMVVNSAANRIYCVIDGIDKCKNIMLQHFLYKVNRLFRKFNDRESPEELKTLRRTPSRRPTDPVFQSTVAQRLRMMILSRERDCVLEELEPFPQLPLSINVEIDNFKKTKARRVSSFCSKNKDPDEEMTDIIDRILNSGPDQSFLFVGLISERIEGMTLKDLRKYEKSAPKTVAEFHCQTLLKVPPKQRPTVLAMLKWVALAERPLTALQLTKAVKYSLSRSFSRRSLNTAVKMCHGLIAKGKEDGQTVFVLGQGAFDLLFGRESPLAEISQLKEFASESNIVHSELANACVGYMQESANLEKSRRVRLRRSDYLNKADRLFFKKHPFLEYTIINWTYHAKRGNLEKTRYDSPFFEDKSTRRRLWWESYWISLQKKLLAWKWTTPGNFSLLHMAAFFDIVPLAQYVHGQGRLERLLSAEDHQGMKPIHWATENSATAMVRFLLEQGDFDDKTLFQAARTGEVSIIRMLLENKRRRMQSSQAASPLSSPESPSSPLQAVRGFTLRSLSDFSKTDKPKPVPMSPADSGYGKTKSETPLHVAAAYGHDEAVAAFLDAGERVSARTDGGWTALHNAAWFGRAPVVDRLISFGADPRADTKDGLTPLHCAVKTSQAPNSQAQNSQAQIIKMLLDKDVGGLEVKDQFGITPFHMACKGNKLSILDLMHQKGADIEERMRIGWTPLMWAAVFGAFDVAQWLIKHDAQVNAVWLLHPHEEAGASIELSPLDLAKSYHQAEIVQLILDHGGVDNRSLASRDSLVLPLPGEIEETYDLPEVQDIALPPLERAETGDSMLSSEEDGSSQDEADDHSADDASDEGSRSRKQSASSVEEDPRHQRQSSFALHGLGISEENENDMEIEESAGNVEKFPPGLGSGVQDAEDVDASMVQKIGLTPSPLDVCRLTEVETQERDRLFEEPLTYTDTQVKDIDLDSTAALDISSSDINQVPMNAQSSTESSTQRKSSGTKSPIALGNLFTRRTWKIGSIGSTKGDGVRDGSQLQSVSAEPQDDTNNVDRTFEPTEEVNNVSKATKVDKGVFGKLKGRRGISWRKDNGGTKGNDPLTECDDNTGISTP